MAEQAQPFEVGISEGSLNVNMVMLLAVPRPCCLALGTLSSVKEAITL